MLGGIHCTNIRAILVTYMLYGRVHMSVCLEKFGSSEITWLESYELMGMIAVIPVYWRVHKWWMHLDQICLSYPIWYLEARTYGQDPPHYACYCSVIPAIARVHRSESKQRVRLEQPDIRCLEVYKYTGRSIHTMHTIVLCYCYVSV